MASRARVEEYRRLNADIVALARRDLEGFFARLDTSDVAAAREALTEFMQALSDTYGRPAALVAAQFYDDLRAASPNATGTYRAVMGDAPDPEEIAGTVRWAVAPLVDGDSDATFGRLEGALQRYVSHSGRDTIALNSGRDPSPGGWARVPSGADTCAWCLILASRGPVYGTEEAAKYKESGDKYHDDCNCVPTQVWDGDGLPDGYDPDALYGEYMAAREQAESGSINKIAAELRQNLGTN